MRDLSRCNLSRRDRKRTGRIPPRWAQLPLLGAWLLHATVALGTPPKVGCAPGDLSSALDTQLAKVKQAEKSHEAATGVGRWKPQAHESFSLGVQSGAIPERSVITFVDGAGQEKKLIYLRTEVKNGKSFIVYENASGNEGRIALDEFVAGARPDSIKLSAGVGKPKPPAKVAGYERTEVAVDAKGPGVHPGEPAPAKPGEPAVAPAGKVTVRGADGAPSLELHFPEVQYVPIPPGKSAQVVAEGELGFPLGKELTHGGMRRVYTPKEFPGQVVKVYDPSLMAGGVGDPSTISELIQRELAMEDFLTRAGVRVAKIDRSAKAQELWKHGIILQEKVEGTWLWGYLGDHATGDIPKVDAFMKKIYKYDADMQKVVFDRYGLKLSVSHEGGDPIPVGIDIGSEYSNIHVDANGDPIMIDW